MNPILERGPRLRRGALLVGVIGTPIIFLRFLNDPFNLPKLSLLTIVVIVAGAIRVAEALQGTPSENLKLVWVPAAAVTVPLTVSWLASVYPGWSLFGDYTRLQGLVPYLVIVAFGVLLADAFHDRPRSLAWGLTIAGGAVGGYAFAQWIGIDPFIWVTGGEQTRQALSTLGNSNFSGGFLGVVLPVMFALWLGEKDRRGAALRLTVLAVAGLVVTFSQGGWAAAIAGGAIVAGHHYAPRAPWIGRAALAVAGAVAVGVVSIVVLGILKPDSSLVPLTTAYRGQWWISAVDMVSERPITGFGPNAFALEQPSFRTEADALANEYVNTDDPHNVYLAFAANAGLLGLAGFLLMSGWVLKRMPRDGAPLLRMGFWAAAVAYLVQAIVSLDELSLRVSLWVAIAGLVASHETATKTKRAAKRSGRSPKTAPLRRAPAVLLVGVVALAGVLWALSWVYVDARVRTGVRAFASDQGESGERILSDAIALRDLIEYRYLFASKLGETALFEEERSGEGDPFYERMRREFGYLSDLPHLPGHLNHARYTFEWGREISSSDVIEESVDLWRRAVAIDPHNPLLRADLADVLIALDRPDDALEVLDPAVETVETSTDAAYARVWATLAEIRDGLGDESGALAAAERALTLDPDQERAAEIRDELAD